MIALLLPLAGWVAGWVLLRRWPIVGPARRDGVPVSVVVPARNEALRIGRLLATCRADEVIVVDDGSTDGTADVAAAHGAGVVHVDGPDDGWTGKTWACHVGVGAATHETVVLLDADTWLAADALPRLVFAHAALAPDGLLSVQPFHVTERPFEQLSAVANVVTAMASPGLAFGPCLVTTKSALAAAGGFGAVRDDAVEDIGLAHAYRAVGRSVARLGGGDAVRFRMYDSLPTLVTGWTKGLASGASRGATVPVLGSVLWVAGALAAMTSPIAYVAYAVQLAWLLRRLGRFRVWTWLLFPVPLLAFVALFAASFVQRARGAVRWRGRTIELRR